MAKKNNDYDFDLILSNDTFKRNQEKCSKKKFRKIRKLKKWVKPLLLLLIGSVIGIAIYQLFTLKENYTTPAGSYTCIGGIVKVCTGTSSVADYIGA